MPPIDAPLLRDSGVSNLAITPDGRRIFYTARRLDPDGVRIAAGQLVSRELGAFETTPLPNTGMRPVGPFTSPDGAWVGFQTATGARVAPVLAKVPATGGAMVVLCDLGPRGALRGASWTGDGRIVFATSQTATGLQMVPDTGGSPTILTTPDAAKGERAHRWPDVLPGGKGTLFGILRDDNTVDIALLAAGEPALRVLVRGAGAPRYLADGFIVYSTGGTLYGVRFDLQSLAVSGEPVALVDGVQTATAGVADFAVAANGTLAYLPGGERQVRSRLVWLHRDGAITALPLEARTYQSARLSPDGRRIAVVMTERGTPNIWIYDLVRDTFTRVTPRDEMVDAVVWSPDSSRLAFWSDTKKSIFMVAVDGGDRSDALVSVDIGKLYPNAWTPDGRSMVFIRETPRLGLFTVPLTAPRDVQPFVSANGAQVEAQFSPDGRWVTHAVFDGGRPEVVVGPATVPDRRWQVATAGRQPRWSKDGREVLFIEGGAIFSVPIDSRTGMASGRARKTLDLPPRMASVRPLELATDGRFLMLERVDDENARGEIRLVLNWFDELRTKLRPRE